MAVHISRLASAHPDHIVPQAQAAAVVGALSEEPRRVEAIARATRIDQRRTVLPVGAIANLGSIEERNTTYRDRAPDLACAVADMVVPASRRGVGALFTVSCTGYSVPGWGVEVVRRAGLSSHVTRVPITEAGCAGGGLALARAADFVTTHPGQSALVVAVELCSLAFHPDATHGNLTAALIFGDGAGAALLTGDGDGPRVVDTMSVLVPDSVGALRFDLTDRGFFPVIGRELPHVVMPAVQDAATRLLRRNGLSCDDIGAWLVHPGGARILDLLDHALGLGERLRWSRASMAEFGNTSSAAVFDVLRRYVEDPCAPRGPALAVGLGPGLSLELLLLDWA